MSYEWYRCTHENGSKDWAITRLQFGIETVWGPTGKTVQRSNKPLERCKERSADVEFRKLIREKERKGYVHLGSADVVNGRLQPNRDRGALVHWTSTGAIRQAAFDERVSAWCPALNAVDSAVVVRSGPSRIAMTTGKETWWFGFGDFKESLSETEATSGKVPASFGATAVLMVLAAQKEWLGTIVLADELGVEVQPTFSSSDPYLGAPDGAFIKIREAAIGLGLCPRPESFFKPGIQTMSGWF